MLKCCQDVQSHCQPQPQRRISRKREVRESASATQEIAENQGLPHSEVTLASLVRVCIRGGNKDLAQHLEGVTMRVQVVSHLIEVLRKSLSVVDAQSKQGKFIVQEKGATPPEPQQTVEQWERTERPRYLMAESNARSLSDMHEEYNSVFQQYGTMHITTGSVFLQQC